MRLFFPTPQGFSVGILSSIVIRENVELLHFDAKEAFVQSQLNEEP